LNELMKHFSDEQIAKLELQGEDVAQKLLAAYNLLTDNQEVIDTLIPEVARVEGELKVAKSRKSYLSLIINILTKELKYMDVR
jgi:hypothetical protein